MKSKGVFPTDRLQLTLSKKLRAPVNAVREIVVPLQKVKEFRD